MALKRNDPDATLPGKGFGHVELELAPEVSTAPRPFYGARSEDATQASERTRAAVGDPRLAAMRELYAEGDANGALFIALSIAPNACDEVESAAGQALQGQRWPKPADVPNEDWTVRRDAIDARTPEWRRAPGRFVPRVLRSNDELATMPIDHRGGFLLAHVDGVQTVGEILDVCAMAEEEAVRLIEDLVAMGAIALDPGESTPPPGSRCLR